MDELNATGLEKDVVVSLMQRINGWVWAVGRLALEADADSVSEREGLVINKSTFEGGLAPDDRQAIRLLLFVMGHKSRAVW